MTWTIARRTVPVLLLAAVACSYDSVGYAPTPPPPPVDATLWLSGSATPAIFGLAPTQLVTSGNRDPATVVHTRDARMLSENSMAFDARGTMWIASSDDSMVLAFPREALASSGTRTAKVAITTHSRSLDVPTAVAFDRRHRLWVANFGNGTLVRFDSAQLVTGGALQPAVTISGLGRPTGIAFDAAGALWVSDAPAHTIASYAAAAIEASGTPQPRVVLGEVDGSLAAPVAIAFDASGTLWVANIADATLVAFGPTQLAASGTPAPRVRIGLNSGEFFFPTGLAFDAAGSLWVMHSRGTLSKFTRATLASSGAPVPDVTVTVTFNGGFWGLAFWPRPSGLPLN